MTGWLRPLVDAIRRATRRERQRANERAYHERVREARNARRRELYHQKNNKERHA